MNATVKNAQLSLLRLAETKIITKNSNERARVETRNADCSAFSTAHLRTTPIAAAVSTTNQAATKGVYIDQNSDAFMG